MNETEKIEFLRNELLDKTKETAILKICLVFLFASCAILSYVVHDKSIENEQSTTKHKSALIELNAKLESKEVEIKEVQEWLGVVFEEGADITNKYNELKKQCKKVKR